MQKLARRMMIIFSYGVCVGCLYASVWVVVEAFSTQAYYQLFGLFVLAGAALGALKLNLNLRRPNEVRNWHPKRGIAAENW